MLTARRLLPLKDTTIVNTLSISTQYFGGNVRPSLTLIYDWVGAVFVQPGMDWTFMSSTESGSHR